MAMRFVSLVVTSAVAAVEALEAATAAAAVAAAVAAAAAVAVAVAVVATTAVLSSIAMLACSVVAARTIPVTDIALARRTHAGRTVPRVTFRKSVQCVLPARVATKRVALRPPMLFARVLLLRPSAACALQTATVLRARTRECDTS